MKTAFVFLAGSVLGFLFAKQLNGTSDRYISLANVRRGIKEGWYTAKLATKDDLYYVRLTGREADGDITSSYYEISQSTYNALLEDGVEKE